MLICFISLIFAQKATFKKDTVYKYGKAYAIFKAKGKALIGQHYLLQTLSSKEIMYLKLKGGDLKGYMPIYENRKFISK